MSPKTIMIATAALAMAAAAQPALAASGPQPGDPPLRAAVMFNLLDSNGDGVVDATEAAAVTTAIFATLDVNGDDKLTSDELQAAVGRMHMGPGPRQGQRGHDGARWQGRDGAGGQGPDGRPGHQFGMMRPDAEGDRPFRLQLHDFASIDSDGDGVISQEEFDAIQPMGPGPGPAR